MPKREIPAVEYSGIRLRLLEEADLPLTLSWRNQDNVRKWFFYNEVISPDQHQDWYRRYQDLDTDFVFIIEACAPEPVPVGQISLYHMDWEAKRAEYGRVMIGPAWAQGKGYAKAATIGILKIAKDIGLNEVYLEVKADNQRAFSLYLSVGFEVVTLENNVYHMRVLVSEG